ncbi:hypothetical protein L7F22_019158 [Adiantum nelumboides]|nr:hypothetical protein [Adiantum nelumboides]
MAPKKNKSSGSSTSSSQQRTNAEVRRSAGSTTNNTTRTVNGAAVRELPESVPGTAFTWFHLFQVLAVYAFIASLTLWSHYHLPTPKSIDTNTLDEPAHFSELKALEHISKLSDDIGYRIVGTKEHVEAEKWIENVVKSYEGWHKTIIEDEDAEPQINATQRRTDPRGDTQVEVWTQIADGAHRFDFISSVVWKKYYSMSNVIVRISDGTDEGKEHAVLLNAHLDSTLPSPGAADDGAGIAILLEILRIYTTPPRPRLRHSVILLFNNGEESFQDASHLYATQHETRHSVRGVVNLEACGTSGPELLFQATSVPFVEAYSKVPYPFGTVMANDVFSTGLILSDTDFRQFVQYANQSGLDMAIVGNSYQYHTRLDLTKNLEPGMMQHFGENVLAIVNHLVTSPRSNLAINKPFPRSAPPIYFSIASRFFILIPAEKFRTVIMGISALSNYLLTSMGRADKHQGALKYALLSLFFTVTSLLSALIFSNAVALIMIHLVGKPLSWFAKEWYPIVLFGPPALAGILSNQYLFASVTRKDRRAYLERASLDGLSLFFVLSLLTLSAFGIGSCYLAGLGSIAMTVVIALNDLYLIGFDKIEQKQVPAHKRVHPISYLIYVIVPASIGSEGLVSFLDLFVPLTGRTGEISPADHIVGSIAGALTFLCLPFALPMSFRMGRERLAKVIVFFLTISIACIAIFASPALKPFDVAHPKRVFVHAVQNVTSDTFWLNLGGADPDVKGLEGIVDDVWKSMGIDQEPFTKVDMDDYNPDFAILYPVSTFLTPYKMRVPMPQPSSPWTLPDGDEFVPKVSNEKIDWQAGTRSFTLTIRRPNLIWSVIALDADIIEWDLTSPPPPGMQRHHIKEVARHGIDEWSVTMTIRLPSDAQQQKKSKTSSVANPIRLSQGVPERDPTKLWIDYSGLIAEAMWPQAKKLEGSRRQKYPSIDVLERLDEVLLEKHPEVDSMLLSVVAAVAQV